MSENAAMVEGLTREELYEQVWSKPVTHLAKSFGLSDAGLAKICRDLNIPKPGRGYWWKLEMGIPVERTPLPGLEDGEKMQVHLNPAAKPTRPPKQLTETEQKVADERKEENRIWVSDRLDSPHSLVEQTQRSLANAKTDDEGRVRSKAKGCLDVCVAPESVDRAMRIMDALIKALELRGYAISVDKKEGKTWVTVNEERISFSLAELTDRRVKELTPTQKLDRKKNERLFELLYSKEYERIPNDRFTLEIDDYSGSLRRRWSDSSSRRVEDVLNRFVTSLIRISEDIKNSRIEAKERQRIWEEQAPERERLRKEAEERRIEEVQRHRQEKCRAKWLESKLPYWHHAQELRAFIASVRALAIQRHGEIHEGSEIAKWLAWAERYASSIDPLADCNQLPAYTLGEDSLRKLEWGLYSLNSDSVWSPPGQPR